MRDFFIKRVIFNLTERSASDSSGSDWRGNCDGNRDSMWETSPYMTVWRKRWLVTDYDYVQPFIRGFEWRQTSTAASRTSVTKTALSELLSSIILKVAISNSLCAYVPLTSDILQNSVNCNGLYVFRVAYFLCRRIIACDVCTYRQQVRLMSRICLFYAVGFVKYPLCMKL